MLSQQKYTRIQAFTWSYRSSHKRGSVRKGVLRNFSKFTVKHLGQSLFFNKVAGSVLQLY